MCIAVAFFGLSFTGFMVNPLDIAPKYAGIIIGLSNCISTTPGFIGPSLVGIITRDEVGIFFQNLMKLIDFRNVNVTVSWANLIVKS